VSLRNGQLIDRGVGCSDRHSGRLLSHFERGKLLLTACRSWLLDEGLTACWIWFSIPDIERIFSLTPFTRPTLFFSATMAPEIERITNTFLSSPERVRRLPPSSASATINARLLSCFKRQPQGCRKSSEKRSSARPDHSEGRRVPQRDHLSWATARRCGISLAKSLMEIRL